MAMPTPDRLANTFLHMVGFAACSQAASYSRTSQHSWPGAHVCNVEQLQIDLLWADRPQCSAEHDRVQQACAYEAPDQDCWAVLTPEKLETP